MKSSKYPYNTKRLEDLEFPIPEEYLMWMNDRQVEYDQAMCNGWKYFSQKKIDEIRKTDRENMARCQRNHYQNLDKIHREQGTRIIGDHSVPWIRLDFPPIETRWIVGSTEKWIAEELLNLGVSPYTLYTNELRHWPDKYTMDYCFAYRVIISPRQNLVACRKNFHDVTIPKIGNEKIAYSTCQPWMVETEESLNEFWQIAPETEDGLAKSWLTL